MADLAAEKDKGNDLFKQKKFPQAIAQFQTVISTIEARNNKDYLSPNTQVGKLYVVCLINAAFACININTLEKYTQAIVYCDKALSIDQSNLKGLYRRGLAKKQKGHIIETSKSVQQEGLLEIYQSAKEDFEKLCLLDKTNELATKHLSETVKDIYRVTVARGQEVDLTSKKQKNSDNKSKNPYEIPEGTKKRNGPDMNRIMKEYKVEEVTQQVQHKVRSQYLTNPLPELRSDLQKAMRTIEKSEQTYIKFVERFDLGYLNKVQPTFDMLQSFVSIIIKKGQSQDSKKVLSAIKLQKSFTLLWKSYSKKQKEALKQKMISLGFAENQCP